MLRKLRPPDRALVWGILGGIPLYLTWWDQQRSARENLARLVCRPGGRLLDEGRLVLATDAGTGELGQLVLRAIAAGRTKHGEIEQAVRAEPARTLDRLMQLRLIERDRSGHRGRLAHTPAQLPYRGQLSRVLAGHRRALQSGDRTRSRAEHPHAPDAAARRSHGRRWEEAFRSHLRRLAAGGELVPDVVRIGPFWSEHPAVEIDAVALAGRREEAVLLGEAKWTRSADAGRLVHELEGKASALPQIAAELHYAVCARERLTKASPGILALTASDIFP